MKTTLLFGSTHGRTRKVAGQVARSLGARVATFDVKDVSDTTVLHAYDLLVFLCPTYGDEELQDDMERFFERLEMDLTGKLFAICELGSYYGYEDFSFGAMRILREEMLARNAVEFCEHLSLDSFPRLNETQLLDWTAYLKGKINEHIGHCHAA